jgi:hypothetical protein
MSLRRCVLILAAALALAAAGCVARDPLNPFAPPTGLQPLP